MKANKVLILLLSLNFSLLAQNQLFIKNYQAALDYLARDSVAQALHYFILADSALSKEDNPKLKISLKKKIASLNYDLGNYQTAFEQYVFLLKNNELTNRSEKIEILYTLGLISKKLNDTIKAIDYLEKALVEASKTEDYDKMKNIATSLSTVYRQKNDLQKANLYKKIAYECKVKIIENEILRQNEYILEQNRLLDEKNQNLKLQQSILEITVDSLERLKEKERRIRNILSAIETSKKMSELLLKYKEQELNRKKTQIYLLTFVVLSFLVLLSLAVYYAYERKKAFKELTKYISIVEKQKQTILTQKAELSKIHDEIRESIVYASKLQLAIMPATEALKQYFDDVFIFFKPRDVVSGDFYWFGEVGEYLFFAEVDCTGHGVPGAFLSMLSYTLLNQIILNEYVFVPSRILKTLDEYLIKTLHSEMSDNTINEGLDISLVRIDDSEIAIAAANQSPVCFIDDKMYIIEGDLFSIGQVIEGISFEPVFQDFIFDLGENNMIYLFSDGFTSQFNEKKEKYLFNKFVKFLSTVKNLPLNEQYKALEKEFVRWKGKMRQIDDVLVVGIKISTLYPE